MIKAVLRCNLTHGEFDLWFNDEAEIPDALVRVQATLVRVEPSSQLALDLALLETMLGVRQQMRPR